MIRGFNIILRKSRVFKYINSRPLVRLYKSNDKTIKITKIHAIGTGKILPKESNPSLHIKYGLLNPKFNILLSDGDVFVPVASTILDIASDFSSVSFMGKDGVKYAIFLGDAYKYVKKDNYLSSLYIGKRLYAYEKLFTLNISSAYKDGILPILAFCIEHGFDYEKINHGKVKACENVVFVYY